VKNKSCLLGSLKAWDQFINHMTIIFKQLVSNIKLDRALEYIILKSLEMITPIHQKRKTLLRGQKMLHFDLLLTS
jgi:small nuclear ribonucleoprotein (snRNP)-like protein